jgi:hypothetical protein
MNPREKIFRVVAQDRYDRYVGNKHTLKLVTRPPFRTLQNLTTPNSLADENSASSLTVPKQKPTALLQTLNDYFSHRHA